MCAQNIISPNILGNKIMIHIFAFKRQLQSQQFFYLDLTFSQLNKQKSGNDNKENDQNKENYNPCQTIEKELVYEKFKKKREIITFKDSEKSTFMSYDYWLTEEMRRLTYTLIDFIQSGYNVTVRKITCKFIENSEGRLVFIGAKDLFVEYPMTKTYRSKRLSVGQFKTISNGLIVRLNKVKQSDTVVGLQVKRGPCLAGFCSFFRGNDKLRRINARNNYERYPNIRIKFDQALNIRVSLILKTRKNLIRIIEVLKQNDISSIHSNEMAEQIQDTWLDKRNKLSYQTKRINCCRQCHLTYKVLHDYFMQQFEQNKKATMKMVEYEENEVIKRNLLPRINQEAQIFQLQLENLRKRADPNSIYSKNIQTLYREQVNYTILSQKSPPKLSQLVEKKVKSDQKFEVNVPEVKLFQETHTARKSYPLPSFYKEYLHQKHMVCRHERKLNKKYQNLRSHLLKNTPKNIKITKKTRHQTSSKKNISRYKSPQNVRSLSKMILMPLLRHRHKITSFSLIQ